MASERPSMDRARPSYSRFIEGSMNDRASAAPPIQYIEPGQLAAFERQFYAERKTRSNGKHGPRPLSASAQLQGNAQALASLQGQSDGEQPQLKPKRTSGLLGRLRDAFGFGSRTTSKVQNEMANRASLQQPPPLSPSPQRRYRVRMSQSQSQQMHNPQLPISTQRTNVNGHIDRPSRDEVLQSYNQLMATGFFQNHAIQSTRQPPPGARSPQRSAPMPIITSSARSSTDAAPSSPCSSRPSFSAVPRYPDSPRRKAAAYARRAANTFMGPASAPSAFAYAPPPRSAAERGSETPSISSQGSSRYMFRSRKRARVDSDDNTSDSASLTQLSKRVSKKLCKMPNAASTRSPRSATTTTQTPDGVVRLVPATSDGRAMPQKIEKAVRLRSPSPAAPSTPPSNRSKLGVRMGLTMSGSVSNRLRKPMRHSPSRPPVSLHDRFRHGPSASRNAMEMMDIDSRSNGEYHYGHHQHHQQQQVVRGGGGGGTAPEPLSVVPDVNRGIPSVPRIPEHYKRWSRGSGESGGWDENENENENPGEAMDWRLGEAL